MEINLNDKITTTKKHPCGSFDWIVVRTGADVKLKCLNCGRVVMFSRVDLIKKIKKIVGANNENSKS